MRIKILYDNRAKSGFKSAWGFSCLIESEKEKILFDTGWDGTLLLFNMEKLQVNPKEIKKIVISHEHWDHVGGLPYVLNKINNPEVEVFLLKSFSRRLKNEVSTRAKVVEVSEAKKVSEGVFTTGELGEAIKEQSLFIETKNGFVVITGCAHPGIDKILEFVKKFGKIYWVLGGFHDFSNLSYLKDIPVLSPCHCTTYLNEIKDMYPKNYKECACGSEFEF
ncbi:MAG: MBL fold metallo-hydrolase [Thermoproteota archaeon]|jgi:7,8-dihydropterin-6-yl-methyl-4-(beta-D-ribofuranosyl)aminobenzene 5'-phosphate synthase